MLGQAMAAHAAIGRHLRARSRVRTEDLVVAD